MGRGASRGSDKDAGSCREALEARVVLAKSSRTAPLLNNCRNLQENPGLGKQPCFLVSCPFWSADVCQDAEQVENPILRRTAYE